MPLANLTELSFCNCIVIKYVESCLMTFGLVPAMLTAAHFG